MPIGILQLQNTCLAKKSTPLIETIYGSLLAKNMVPLPLPLTIHNPDQSCCSSLFRLGTSSSLTESSVPCVLRTKLTKNNLCSHKHIVTLQGYMPSQNSITTPCLQISPFPAGGAEAIRPYDICWHPCGMGACQQPLSSLSTNTRAY